VRGLVLHSGMPHVLIRPGLAVFRFTNLLDRPDVTHFVSGRAGGVSPPPYASLNLSFRTGDDPEHVTTNRDRLFHTLGVEVDRVVAGKQVHGTRVQVVGPEHGGRGAADWESAFDDTDALVTRAQNLCLLILAADCVPVLVFDPRTPAVGAAHAGWRGTVSDVVGAMVRTMQEAFGSRASDLIAAIGPSIGPTEYEVGPEVVEQVQSAFTGSSDRLLQPRQDSRALLDLWTANTLRLVQAGVPEGQIEVAGVSSYAVPERYFSERRDGAPTGRFGAGIMLL
jgi:polyphenol oxidase